jgi:hypothetical protein
MSSNAAKPPSRKGLQFWPAFRWPPSVVMLDRSLILLSLLINTAPTTFWCGQRIMDRLGFLPNTLVCDITSLKAQPRYVQRYSTAAAKPVFVRGALMFCQWKLSILLWRCSFAANLSVHARTLSTQRWQIVVCPASCFSYRNARLPQRDTPTTRAATILYNRFVSLFGRSTTSKLNRCQARILLVDTLQVCTFPSKVSQNARRRTPAIRTTKHTQFRVQ